MQITELLVRRDDLTAMTAAERVVTLGDGEALFRIETFALTANNVTYAAHGVDVAYWSFFPAPEGFGIVPVWGFASVVESRAEGVPVGARFFGYWPMASHAVLVPGKVKPRGFTDVIEHRQKLPPVYNNYAPASADWGPEPEQALLRILYTTSFVLDVMLADSPAQTLVLTSASSKTALGLAQAAKGRQRIVGLTSAGNIGFVEATGYYDDVLDYDAIDKLGTGTGSVALVDFSGNGAVRHAVHSVLADRLIESHIVGDTHWDAANTNKLPGVAAKWFFAPSVIVARVAEWGPEGYEQRLTAAWQSFLASASWLKVVEGEGAETVAARWRDVASGKIDPAEGLVLRV
jgi:hypothetical protein